jgi:hypothetical protein
MSFLTHLRACSLNPKNSAQGPQTVYDLPTGVGRSLRPDGYPKKFMIAAQRGCAKVLLISYFSDLPQQEQPLGLLGP